jgi:hypothetical protein
MPGVWKARESFTGDLARSGATAAEVKTLVGKMDALRALLMASPAVARPVGFNARISGYLTDFLVPERPDLKARDFPLSAGLWFGAFPPEFNDDGSVDWGETIQIPFDVNLLPRWQTNKPTDWQDITTDVVLHPARYVGGFAGLPRFGRLLIIKKNTKPLWTPVSLQETLQLVVAQRKKDVSPYEDAVARIKKEHAAWTAQHAERQRIQKALAPSQKDPQAYLAQAAQLERVEETTFRKQLAEMTPTANQFWAAALARLREAEHDLGSLSAAEGAVPACLLERVEATAPLSRFVPATTPNCRPVIRPNWDYFDRSLPRTEIQLITIGLRECSNDLNVASGPNPAGCPTNLALLRSLDWESVKALMERGGDPVGRARPSR